MATSDRYNYSVAGTAVTDEIYNVTGTGTNVFGEDGREKGIYESSLEVWTGAGKTGTELVLNTDYEFKNLDADYTVKTGANVYAGWALINTATYNGVNLYFNYTGVGTYTDANDINKLTTDLQQITDDATLTGGYQNHIIEATLTTVNKTLTLPSASTCKGELYRVVLSATTSAKLTLSYSGNFEWKGQTIDPTLYEDGETIEFISDGTNWVVIRFDFDRYYHVEDQKASGNAGGTFTSGAWQTRTLNTEANSPLWGASLSSNQITLPAGNYKIEATAPALQVGRNALRLYNTSDTSVDIVGQSGYSNTTDGSNIAHLIGEISISAAKVYQLEHQCEATKATNGFGTSTGSAFAVTNETFAIVFIKQVLPL